MDRRRRSRPRRALLGAACLALLLAACRADAAPTPRATPTTRATPGSPTIRGTVAPRLVATPRPGAPTTPAAATLLVDQAVGLLLDYDLGHTGSADLYQAAYDGALLALAQGGLLVERRLLRLTNDRRDDAPTFRAAYLGLAELAAPRADQAALAHAAIRAAVARADQCQTRFLAPGDESRADAPYGGIGVTLRDEPEGVAIAEVYPGSPAALAGLRPGDRPIALDGAGLGTLDAAAVGALLRGPAGTPLRLVARRPGGAAPLVFDLARAAVRPPPFAARPLDAPGGGAVAYLRLADLAPGDLAALRAAVGELARAAPRGWVLDLRGTESGPLELLPNLGGLLLPNVDPLGYVVSAAGEPRPLAPAADPAPRPAAPLAILLDGGTRLTGEALAAAARDGAAARLFGEPTAGCAAVSAPYRLADGSTLRITLDPLLTPRRAPLHRVGLRPDEAILPDPAGAGDPALDAAVRWAAGGGR